MIDVMLSFEENHLSLNAILYMICVHEKYGSKKAFVFFMIKLCINTSS